MAKSATEISSATPPLPRRTSGFTLIEILVAVAIVGILCAIALPVYNNYINRAKMTVSISAMETIRKDLEDYHINFGNYPPAIDIATGEDGQGRVVLTPLRLAEFRTSFFSFESYVVTPTSYTLSAKAIDPNHTLLVLTPGQVIAQGQ